MKRATPGGPEEAGVICRIERALDGIEGIAAVVPGGSRATGTATPDSDASCDRPGDWTPPSAPASAFVVWASSPSSTTPGRPG
jgi:hypothetical protein